MRYDNSVKDSPVICEPITVASASVPQGIIFIPSNDRTRAFRKLKSCISTGTVKNRETPNQVRDSSAGAIPNTMMEASLNRGISIV